MPMRQWPLPNELRKPVRLHGYGQPKFVDTVQIGHSTVPAATAWTLRSGPVARVGPPRVHYGRVASLPGRRGR